MITNKLKINDSKTECIVFKFPQLMCDLSGLSVIGGDRFGIQYVEAHIFILETWEFTIV